MWFCVAYEKASGWFCGWRVVRAALGGRLGGGMLFTLMLFAPRASLRVRHAAAVAAGVVSRSAGG